MKLRLFYCEVDKIYGFETYFFAIMTIKAKEKR
jgi:hypothetical protein